MRFAVRLAYTESVSSPHRISEAEVSAMQRKGSTEKIGDGGGGRQELPEVDFTLSTGTPSMNGFEQTCFSYFVSEKREKSHRACHLHRRPVDVGLCWSFPRSTCLGGGVTRNVHGGSKPTKLSREAKHGLAKGQNLRRHSC